MKHDLPLLHDAVQNIEDASWRDLDNIEIKFHIETGVPAEVFVTIKRLHRLDSGIEVLYEDGPFDSFAEAIQAANAQLSQREAA